jgi:hypothetical protein
VTVIATGFDDAYPGTAAPPSASPTVRPAAKRRPRPAFTDDPLPDTAERRT